MSYYNSDNSILYNVLSVVQNGSTALYIASQKGHTKTVQLLLDGGASVDKPNLV